MRHTRLVRNERGVTLALMAVSVFLTLGIYYLVWYYKVNRELRDLGRATDEETRLGRSPLTSLLAISVGWLILVPPFVSMYHTLRRVEEWIWKPDCRKSSVGSLLPSSA